MYTWGCNDEGALGRKTGEGDEYMPGRVETLNRVKVVQVSGGDSHTAALASNGYVYCWGIFRVGLYNFVVVYVCIFWLFMCRIQTVRLAW